MAVIVWELSNSASFPLPTADGTVLVGEVGTFDGTAPVLTLDASGVIGNGAALNVSIPMPSIDAYSYIGSVGTFDKSFPKPSVAITISRAGSAAIEAALPTLVATGNHANTWSFAIEATLPTLEALGSSYADLTATDYSVWVVNTETKMHATYTNWNVNSFGTFNGTQIVSKSDGLYEVTGTDDEGVAIPAKVWWTSAEFNSFMQKRLDAVYCNIRGATKFNIVLWADEQQKRTILPAEVTNKEGIHRVRVLPPLGLAAQSWKVGFETDDADFHLTELELNIIESKRRLR